LNCQLANAREKIHDVKDILGVHIIIDGDLQRLGIKAKMGSLLQRRQQPRQSLFVSRPPFNNPRIAVFQQERPVEEGFRDIAPPSADSG
jgi:hypothetical protein